MEYRDEFFILKVDENQYLFEGKIEKNDYKELMDFLGKSIKKVTGDEIIMDFRSLEYLNSSGIRAVAVFLMDAGKKAQLIINPEITWQRVGISPLAAIRKKDEIKVISK